MDATGVDAPAGPPAPDRLGPYAPIARLSENAHGEVWRALDTEHDRLVMLVTLLSRDACAWLEVRGPALLAASRVSAHERLVLPVAALSDHEPPVLVWENLPDTTTLPDFVRREGALPADQVASLVLDVLDALAHLHAAGIAHGAITPHAVQVDADGRARLCNAGIGSPTTGASWGLAVLGRHADAADCAPYRAPELDTAHAHATPDPATDLYALGGVAAYALTGMPPGRRLSDSLARAGVPLVFARIVDRLVDASLFSRYREAAAVRQIVATVMVGRALKPERPPGFASASSAASPAAADDTVVNRKLIATLIGVAAAILLGSMLLLWILKGSGAGGGRPRNGPSHNHAPSIGSRRTGASSSWAARYGIGMS